MMVSSRRPRISLPWRARSRLALEITSEEAPSGIDRQNGESSRNARCAKSQSRSAEKGRCILQAMEDRILLLEPVADKVYPSMHRGKPESDCSCRSPRKLLQVQAGGRCRARNRV